MHFTKRTYYTLGLVASVLNVLGGVFLLVTGYLTLIYSIASVGAAGMMLFLAPRHTQPLLKYTSLAGALLMVFAMMGGSPFTLMGGISAVCGALGWPVFAYGHWKNAQPDAQDNVRTCASLVFVAGFVQLVGSYLTIPGPIRIVLSIAIAVVQGLLAWVLRNAEPKQTAK